MSAMGTANTDATGRAASGFTLIEVAVTLAVMALVVTLVVPTLNKSVPQASADDVVRSASRLALRRAEWVTLRIDSRGAWDVRGDAQQDSAALARGAVEATEMMPFVLRLSPMGACLLNMTSTISGGQNPCEAVVRAGYPRDAGRTRPQ